MADRLARARRAYLDAAQAANATYAEAMVDASIRLDEARRIALQTKTPIAAGALDAYRAAASPATFEMHSATCRTAIPQKNGTY